MTMSIRQHLMSRGLNPDSHSVIIDDANDIASFLLYNLSGQITGYQQYNPRGSKDHRNDEKNRDQLRYYTFVGAEGSHKKLSIWGLETVEMSDRVIFVTEGVFDAVKLQNAGLPAVAVLANDPKPLQAFFVALGKRVIAILDRDRAGQRLASISDQALNVPEPYHDLGEMPQDSVNRWLEGLGILDLTRGRSHDS